jgi:hypothetical protein
MGNEKSGPASGGGNSGHSRQGDHQGVLVKCPRDGKTYGSHPDAEANGEWCPHCGEHKDTDGHDGGNRPGDVYCHNANSAGYQYCPGCSTPLEHS